MMKSTICAIGFALVAAAASAAPGNNGNGNGNNGNGNSGLSGSLSGSASSFAATAGGSFGNGSSFSEAGQFAGATSSLKGTYESGAMTGTATTESYVEGFDRSESAGAGLSGSIRAGAAWGESSFEGRARW